MRLCASFTASNFLAPPPRLGNLNTFFGGAVLGVLATTFGCVFAARLVQNTFWTPAAFVNVQTPQNAAELSESPNQRARDAHLDRLRNAMGPIGASVAVVD